MLPLALAIAPGLAICLFIYSRDRFNREPPRYLIMSFVLGMLSTVPALFIEIIGGDLRRHFSHQSIWSYAAYAYGVVACSEELSKFLVLRFYAYPKKAFDEPFDGIVYAVMIAMGFATVENIEYVERFGIGTGIVRFFLSVPAHASFAVLMGYFVGQAKQHTRRAGLLMLLGILIAIFFHGTFDFFLFLQQNKKVTQYVSEGLLSFGAFVTFYIAIRMALRTIRNYRYLPDEK